MRTKPERLKFFMQFQGMNQKDLADALGITRANISNYINGAVDVPNPTMLAMKAEFNLNPSWLAHGKEPMVLKRHFATADPEAEKLLKNYQQLARSDLRKQLVLNSDFLLQLDRQSRQERLRKVFSNPKSQPKKSTEEEEVVSVYYLGKTAAGLPIEMPNPDHWDGAAIQIPSSYFGRRSHRRHYVLQVSGDSMVDEGIFDKDYVLIEYKQVAQNNQIVVAIVNGEATLKKLHFDHHGVMLRTGNANIPPIRIESEDHLQIRGVLVRNLGKNVLWLSS